MLEVVDPDLQWTYLDPGFQAVLADVPEVFVVEEVHVVERRDEEAVAAGLDDAAGPSVDQVGYRGSLLPCDAP